MRYLHRRVDGIVYLDCVRPRLHRGAKERRVILSAIMDQTVTERQSLISPFVFPLLRPMLLFFTLQ